jgi:hypothetical protein
MQFTLNRIDIGIIVTSLAATAPWCGRFCSCPNTAKASDALGIALGIKV